jgi:hypothetical protein
MPVDKGAEEFTDIDNDSANPKSNRDSHKPIKEKDIYKVLLFTCSKITSFLFSWLK